jgi:hypothetical protein
MDSQMTWTVEMLEKDWLGARIGVLALSPDAIVAAFCLVEKHLGRSWIEAAHVSGESLILGILPTLRVIAMGQRLVALDNVPGSKRLIEKIRQGDKSAEAELTAIYLVRCRQEIQVELEPAVGDRLADFRVRQKNDVWAYVEVTFPDWSEATERANTILNHVTSLVSQIKRRFALEVFLRREPNEDELGRILAAIPTFCNQDVASREELPDGLGLLLLNKSVPGQVIIDDHGDEPRPRIGRATAILGPDDPHRHVAVRMAYSDQRAEAFLRSEARQLPKDAPGLIMIGTSRAPGAIRVWEQVLKQRFQQGLHTRVGGICLFSGGFLPTARGEAWLPQTKLLLNPHSAFALPSWIQKALTDAGAEFERS